MTNMIKIEMDIACDWYNTEEMAEEFTRFNLEHELIELEGPAGGNPNIWVIGEEANVRAWLQFAGYDEHDVEYYVNGD